MNIENFNSEGEIKKTVKNPKNSEKLIVIDCWAQWCGPCRTFGKFYHDFVKSYPVTENVLFCKLNVDAAQEFCDENGISGIPAILFIRDGKEVDRMVGADTTKFKVLLDKCLKQVNKSSGVGAGASASPVAKNGSGMTSF